MTSFISLYIILGTGCVILLSAEPEISVSGPVGSTAVLPCNLTSVDTDRLYIKWEVEDKIQSETVFERKNGGKYEAEGYEGRVGVPVEELRKGNCSLVLRNLRLTDTGVYSSYQLHRTKRDVSVTKDEISRVNLLISDKTEERMDDNSDSPDKAEERTDENSDSPDNGGRNHYLWLLVLPALVLPGLVVWHLKRRNNTNQL